MCASHLTTVASHLTIIPFELLQIVLTVKGTANPLQRLVQPLLLFLKTLPQTFLKEFPQDSQNAFNTKKSAPNGCL